MYRLKLRSFEFFVSLLIGEFGDSGSNGNWSSVFFGVFGSKLMFEIAWFFGLGLYFLVFLLGEVCLGEMLLVKDLFGILVGEGVLGGGELDRKGLGSGSSCATGVSVGIGVLKVWSFLGSQM